MIPLTYWSNTCTGHGYNGDGEGGEWGAGKGNDSHSHAKQGLWGSPLLLSWRNLYLCVVQAAVEVISILSNEEEVNTAYSGDNIRVKLKGVEEEVG